MNEFEIIGGLGVDNIFYVVIFVFVDFGKYFDFIWKIEWYEIVFVIGGFYDQFISLFGEMQCKNIVF